MTKRRILSTDQLTPEQRKTVYLAIRAMMVEQLFGRPDLVFGIARWPQPVEFDRHLQFLTTDGEPLLEVPLGPNEVCHVKLGEVSLV